MENITKSAGSGFSLIQVSIIVAVAGLVLAATLPGGLSGDYNAKLLSTTQKMQRIDDAMRGYMAANGYRPCPADGQYPLNSQYFGVAVSDTSGGCSGTAPAPEVPLSYTSGVAPDDIKIVGGVVPTKTLGLPDDYAFDAWGRRITYVLDTKATTNAHCLSLQGTNHKGRGNIKIKDANGNIKDYVMYALISHGADGEGAWNMPGSKTTLSSADSASSRIVSQVTDTDTLSNASMNGSFVTSFDNVFVQKDKTATFDDIVYFSNLKNTCCVGTCSSDSPTQRGFVIQGEVNGDAGGYTVAVGDVNGNGYPDIIIGAPGYGNAKGAVYVIFDSTLFDKPFKLAQTSDGGSLNTSTGFRLEGSADGEVFGRTVASGDVNGDGIDDIVIGTGDSCTVGSKVYVVYGQSDFSGWGVHAVISNHGHAQGQGFKITDTGQIGQALAVANINGSNTVAHPDKYADLIFGGIDGVHVVFGAATGSLDDVADLTAAAYTDGSKGFKVGTLTTHPMSGPSKIAAGDFNGDGIADFAVADLASGDVYLIFGADSFSTPFTQPTSGATGFRINGAMSSGKARTVSLDGDIDHDGKRDLIIGTIQDSPISTTLAHFYVLFGRTATTAVDLSSWSGGVDGFRIDGIANNSSMALGATAGDLYHESTGYDEVVIAQPAADPDGSGTDFPALGVFSVVFGKSRADWASTPVIDASTLGAGNTTGFRSWGVDNRDSNFHANDFTGVGMAMGNINRDSHGKELIVGVPLGYFWDSNPVGGAYVYSGSGTLSDFHVGE